MTESENISEIPISPSSGNVFADLGFPSPEEELLKADLVREIIRTIQQRRLSQARTAEILGLSQRTVSDLVNGDYEKLPIDRLLRFLSDLGVDVEIVLRQTENEHGQTRVSAVSESLRE